jgi:hypothetical protein
MPETFTAPPLYSAAPDGTPKLNGGRCRACGYVFFPPQSYGCEICGAAEDQLEPSALRGEGVLRSFATVHLYQGKGIEAPFTIGVILLDDGPAVRATLTEKTDAGLKIGDRMRTVLVRAASSESGAEETELRFARQEQLR